MCIYVYVFIHRSYQFHLGGPDSAGLVDEMRPRQVLTTIPVAGALLLYLGLRFGYGSKDCSGFSKLRVVIVDFVAGR